jgi:hypothetical protein
MAIVPKASGKGRSPARVANQWQWRRRIPLAADVAAASQPRLAGSGGGGGPGRVYLAKLPADGSSMPDLTRKIVWSCAHARRPGSRRAARCAPRSPHAPAAWQAPPPPPRARASRPRARRTAPCPPAHSGIGPHGSQPSGGIGRTRHSAQYCRGTPVVRRCSAIRKRRLVYLTRPSRGNATACPEATQRRVPRRQEAGRAARGHSQAMLPPARRRARTFSRWSRSLSSW